MGFLSLFKKMPEIPAGGVYFSPHYIVDHSFEKNRSDAMSNLIAYFNNILFETERYFFGAAVDQNDPLFEIIRQFEPRIDAYDVIIKAIKGELPDIGRFYFDFRDMAP